MSRELWARVALRQLEQHFGALDDGSRAEWLDALGSIAGDVVLDTARRCRAEFPSGAWPRPAEVVRVADRVAADCRRDAGQSAQPGGVL